MEQLGPELLKRLDTLAQSLGVTVEYLWEILVRQGTIEGYLMIAGTFIALAFALAGVWSFRKGLKYFESDDGDQGIPYTVIGIVVGLAGGVFTIVNGFSAASYFLNPEYFALRQILKLLN